jgi:predicted methyltransferase
MTALAIVTALLLAADPAPATPAKAKPASTQPTAKSPPAKAAPAKGAGGPAVAPKATTPKAKHGGAHGNPTDLGAYTAALLDPKRDEWQKPDEVVKALGLSPGQVVCDVGAGPGYFTLRLAAAVGPSGRVFAVDVEAPLLVALRERLGELRQVTPVLAVADDPLLPRGACDLVLVVDTFHHFPDGVAYLWRLATSLKPGGRIVNIDFHRRETPVGPPVARRVAREDFLAAAASAGLALTAEHDFLPHQYFVVLSSGSAPR